MFHRGLLPQYLTVAVFVALGVWLGVAVLDARPAALGWLFGAGAGLMVGGYVAAIASGVPLAGSARSTRTPPPRPAGDGWIDELEAELPELPRR
jgi:hypothetical protein